MKKIFCMVLCLAVLLSLGVFAQADVNIHNGDLSQNDSIDVTAVFQAGTTTDAPTAYYVTVNWEQTGTIRFSGESTVYTWNPTGDNALTYTAQSAGGSWTVDNAKLTVTVTNYSNAAVVANFGALAAVSGSGVTSITSQRSAESVTIPSAATQGQTTEGIGEAQMGVCVYTITGVQGSITQNKTIGTLTVSIGAAA